MSIPISDAFLGTIQHEKARLGDEGVTKSQLVAGRNMTIIVLPNYDLQFNAAGGMITNITNGEVIIQPRMMTGELLFSRSSTVNFYSHVFPQFSPGSLQESITDVGVGSAADRSNFSTILISDINHNWNLSNPNAWLLTLTDSRAEVGMAPTAYDSIVKAVPINANTVRVYAGYRKSVGAYQATGYDLNPNILTCNYNGTKTVTSTTNTTGLIAGMTVESTAFDSGISLITAVSNDGVHFTVATTPNTSPGTISTFYLWRKNEASPSGVMPKQGYMDMLPSYIFTIEEYR